MEDNPFYHSRIEGKGKSASIRAKFEVRIANLEPKQEGGDCEFDNLSQTSIYQAIDFSVQNRDLIALGDGPILAQFVLVL